MKSFMIFTNDKKCNIFLIFNNTFFKIIIVEMNSFQIQEVITSNITYLVVSTRVNQA